MARFGIGQPVLRREDVRFLTGVGRYVDDGSVPGTAFAVVVRSTHAHARIKSIDASRALTTPEVVAVLTGDDARRDGIGDIVPLPLPPKIADPGIFLAPHPVLAQDTVRYVGQPVALVVAGSREAAKDGAEAIIIDYEPLDSAVRLSDATSLRAPTLWPRAPGNVAFTLSFGDRAATDRALAAAHRRVALTLANNRLSANAIEPRAALGTYHPREDRYTLFTTSQTPHRTRTQLARDVLRVPEWRLRIVAPDVGGGFGMKGNVYPEEALVLWAARRTGRPVRWTAERGESLASDMHARDEVWEGELAFDRDGRLLALRAQALFNLGAYVATAGAVPPLIAASMAPSVYDVRAVHVVAKAVYTHTAPTGPYRGAGQPEATYFIERLFDLAATELAVDRAELRRRNLIRRESMPYKTALTYTYDSGDFPAVMAKTLAIVDWHGFAKRRRDSEAKDRLRGIGLSYFIEQTALFNDRMEIRFDAGGDATIVSGTHSHGQGHETVYAQMVSEWLGIPADRLGFLQGDTDQVAFGRGTFASRSMTVGGSALRAAADAVIDKGRRYAAHLMEAPVEDVQFADGVFRVAGTDRSVGLVEVARAAHAPAGMPTDLGLGLEGVGTFAATVPNFPNGCHACEVEIDTATGYVEIVRYVAVDDVGRVINPLLLAGQVHGGLTQGIGQAVLEHLRYDAVSGQLISGSFLDYGMPRAADLPSFEVETYDVPTPSNPLGVKGAGEAGCVGAPPAVIGAILDALAPFGVADIEMPATPERVWRAIQGVRSK